MHNSFVTPWTVAHQAPLSVGFSRPEYWSGLPFPSPGDLPNPGFKPMPPALAEGFFTSEGPGKPSAKRRKLRLRKVKARFTVEHSWPPKWVFPPCHAASIYTPRGAWSVTKWPWASSVWMIRSLEGLASGEKFISCSGNIRPPVLQCCTSEKSRLHPKRPSCSGNKCWHPSMYHLTIDGARMSG